MIPTRDEAMQLWDTYALPQPKRIHVVLVEKVALLLAEKVRAATDTFIDTNLLRAAALLHDIDKAVPKAVGEHHPDTGVRILKAEGMEEVAAVVRTHSLSSLLDDQIAPKTWEEKLLYLADKMVKYEVVGVDERFALWRKEHLPSEALAELDRVYPKVKQLEAEICTRIGLTPRDIIRLAR